MRKGATVSWKVALAAIVLVTAGCGAAPGSAPDTELVWAVGGIRAADEGPAKDIANRWNDEHENGPKVRVVALPESADDQRQLMALELKAGLDDLDILQLDVIWTAEFAEKDWLADLAGLRTEIEQKSLPGAVQSALWDGKLWAAPYTSDAGILYYRSDLVDPPASWKELEETGREVGAREGIAPFVADGAQYEGLVVQYLEYFWGAGGDVLDPDGRTVLFQRDHALEAAEFMRSAFSTGLYAPGFDTMKLEEARDTFSSGQAVFMRSWPYAYKSMNEPDSQVAGRVGIAPLPAFGDSAPVTGLGGHNLAVSRFSDNIPAATEFVRFVSTSPEIQQELATKHSLAPTLKSTYADLSHDPVNHPLMALLAEVLPQAKPRPATPEWTTISEEMQQQIFAAYHGSYNSDDDPAPEIDALRDFLVATVQGR